MSIVIESDKVKHYQTEETGYINGSRFDIPANYFGTVFVTGITIFIIASTMCFGISQQRCKIFLLILSAGMYVKTASNVILHSEFSGFTTVFSSFSKRNESNF